jgi:hypothetical protein
MDNPGAAPARVRTAVLISGRGSNLEALIGAGARPGAASARNQAAAVRRHDSSACWAPSRLRPWARRRPCSLPSQASASALLHSSSGSVSAVCGRAKRTIWQRLRSVAGKARQRSATSRRCVAGRGSSIVFSKAFTPPALSASAGATIATLACP